MGYSTKIMVRRRRVLVLGQFGVFGKLGVFEVPNATVHLLVSLSVLSSFVVRRRRTIIRRRRTKSKRLLT